MKITLIVCLLMMIATCSFGFHQSLQLEKAPLAPCGELQRDCTPGYKHPGDKEYDFYIKDYKHGNNSD